MGAQVRLIESRDRLPLTHTEWNALAARNPTHTAFQTFEWFDAWWSAFGSRHRLFLLTVHDADAIVGIAPLMLVRGPLGLRQLELVGTPNADYQDLIVPANRDAAYSAIAGFLHAKRRRWDMLVLRNVPAASPTVAGLTSACARLGLRVMAMERQPCPALVWPGREPEIRRLLERYSIRRSVKKLTGRGAVGFRVLDTPDAIDRYLPVFFQQHAQRWATSRSRSPFNDPAFCNWYRNLAHAAHAAGWLHFSVLECGGTPAAFHFGFQHGGVLSWYKPSYSPDFARESPGVTLIQKLIEDAIARGLGELDFAAGHEPFKDRFSNTRRECTNLRAFSGAAFGTLFVTGARARTLARKLWRRIRNRAPAGSAGARGKP